MDEAVHRGSVEAYVIRSISSAYSKLIDYFVHRRASLVHRRGPVDGTER